MERIGSKSVHEGRIVDLRIEEFRYEDGSTSEREVVKHPGAVAIVATDDDTVLMVRQPREPVEDAALLEVPAGKLDVPGESRLDCARRELAEETGFEADEWRELVRFFPSPGILSEEVTVFRASGLRSVQAGPDEGERVELVRAPLADLDSIIDECRDGKSLVGLLLLREELREGRGRA